MKKPQSMNTNANKGASLPPVAVVDDGPEASPVKDVEDWKVEKSDIRPSVPSLGAEVKTVELEPLVVAAPPKITANPTDGVRETIGLIRHQSSLAVKEELEGIEKHMTAAHMDMDLGALPSAKELDKEVVESSSEEESEDEGEGNISGSGSHLTVPASLSEFVTNSKLPLYLSESKKSSTNNDSSPNTAQDSSALHLPDISHLLSMTETPYKPNTSFHPISTEVFALRGSQPLTALEIKPLVVYDTECVAVVHRVKSRSTSLASTRIFCWIGKRWTENAHERRKLTELSTRHGTQLVGSSLIVMRVTAD